eukprot:m51a1_g14718 hypothetical protein (1842) ;mRNA; f:176151-186390
MSVEAKEEVVWDTFVSHLRQHDLSPPDILYEQELRSLLCEFSAADQATIVSRWRHALSPGADADAEELAPNSPPPPAHAMMAAAFADLPGPAVPDHEATDHCDEQQASPRAPQRGSCAMPITRRMLENPAQWVRELPVPAPSDLYPASYSAGAADDSLRNVGVHSLEWNVPERSRQVASGLGKGLTPDQSLAVLMYVLETQGAGDAVALRLNEALLRRDIVELVEWRSYLWHLTCGLRALPEFSGTAYFGVEDFMEDSFRPAMRFSWPTFISATTVPTTPGDFVKGYSSGTFFQISARWARSLEGVAPHTACQVLFEPNCEFEVTNIASYGPVFVVSLVQLPYSAPFVPTGDSVPAAAPDKQGQSSRNSSVRIISTVSHGSLPASVSEETNPSRKSSRSSQAQPRLMGSPSTLRVVISGEAEAKVARSLSREKTSGAVLEQMVTYMTSAAVVRAGCLRLLRIMKGTDAPLVQHAHDEKEELCQSGLATVLLLAMQEHAAREDTMEAVCPCLRALTTDTRTNTPVEKNCNTILSAGGAHVVLACMEQQVKSPRSAVVASNLCWILRSSLHYEPKGSNVREAAIGLLLSFLRHFHHSADVAEAACGALGLILSANGECPPPDSAIRVTREGGMELCLGALVLHTKNSGLASATVEVLHFLTRIDDMCDEFVRLGGVTAMAAALKAHSKSTAVAEHSLAAVTNLTKKSGTADLNRLAFAREGGVVLAMHALKRFAASAAISYRAMCLLCNLCQCEALRPAVVRNGAIQAIMASLKQNLENPEVAHVACRTLFSLSADEKNLVLLTHEQGIVVMMAVIRQHVTSPVIVEKACGVLGNLAFIRVQNITQIGAEGGVELILLALRSHFQTGFVVEDACRALKNLCTVDCDVGKSGANSSPGPPVVFRADFFPAGDYDYDYRLYLFSVEPSGSARGFFATALGTGNRSTKTELEMVKLNEIACCKALLAVARLVAALQLLLVPVGVGAGHLLRAPVPGASVVMLCCSLVYLRFFPGWKLCLAGGLALLVAVIVGAGVGSLGTVPGGGVAFGVAAAVGSMFLLPVWLDRCLVGARLHGDLLPYAFAAAYTASMHIVTLASPVSLMGVPGSELVWKSSFAQLLCVVGMPGVFFLCALFSALAAAAINAAATPRLGGSRTEEFRHPRTHAALWAAFLFALWLFSGLRDSYDPDNSPRSSSVRVAGVLSRSTNLRTLLNTTRQAAQTGAKVVLWTEYATDAVSYAEDPEDLRGCTSSLCDLVGRVRSLAQELSIYVVPSLLVSHYETPGGPYRGDTNRVLMVTPNGDIKFNYAKAYPLPSEDVIPGSRNIPYSDTEYGRIGAVICMDSGYPFYMTQAGRKRLDILLIPSNDWKDIYRVTTYTFALRGVENGYWFAHEGQSWFVVADIPVSAHRFALYPYLFDVHAFLCYVLVVALCAHPNVGSVLVCVACVPSAPAPSGEAGGSGVAADHTLGLVTAVRPGAPAVLSVLSQPPGSDVLIAQCPCRLVSFSRPELNSATRLYTLQVEDSAVAGLAPGVAAALAGSAPLQMQSLWDAGTAVARCEEPEAGTGWLYSWSPLARSRGDCFLAQEWGVFATHACRVAMVHPASRGIVLPLVECATRAAAVSVLAWLTEAEQCAAFDRDEAYAAALAGRARPPAFGRALRLFAAEGSPVPPVVADCVAWLRARGLDTEFVFRVAPVASHVAALRDAYNNEEDVDLEERVKDPHTVAGVLKTFLRELPEPLVPHRLGSLAPEGEGTPATAGDLMAALAALPAENRATLAEVAALAREVTLHEKAHMDAESVATCLAPAVSGSRAEVAEQLAAVRLAIKLFRFLLDNWTTVEPCLRQPAH